MSSKQRKWARMAEKTRINCEREEQRDRLYAEQEAALTEEQKQERAERFEEMKELYPHIFS